MIPFGRAEFKLETCDLFLVCLAIDKIYTNAQFQVQG